MEAMIPTPDEVAALVKKLRRLGICDPACQGRCRECPQTVADKAADALESLSPPGGIVKDAERYRWLRDRAESQFRCTLTVPHADAEQEYEHQWFGKMAAEHLDKYIDAAMLSARERKE